MNWKDKLLSSSVPLEYEVGKILTENDFCVDFDYTYKRFDESDEKEFSVDIIASRYNPFKITKSRNTILDLDLIVECKYRNPSIDWLFIPEINNDGFKNFSGKGVIKVFDEFSEINSRSKTPFDQYLETCLKGIEINSKTGDAHDTGIRHGINQLLYSLPHLICQQISLSFRSHINDVHPFVICPILVTTANLRILKEDFSIEKLQTSECLNDVSGIVPYLKLHTAINPSFTIHCSNIFEGIPSKEQIARFNHFNELRHQEFDINNLLRLEEIYTSTSELLLNLQNGNVDDLFSQFIICNLNSFPELLNKIKDNLKILIEGFEKIKSS
jgi:hypothetical protein